MLSCNDKRQHTIDEDFYCRCNSAHHIYGAGLDNMNKNVLQDIPTYDRGCRSKHRWNERDFSPLAVCLPSVCGKYYCKYRLLARYNPVSILHLDIAQQRSFPQILRLHLSKQYL